MHGGSNTQLLSTACLSVASAACVTDMPPLMQAFFFINAVPDNTGPSVYIALGSSSLLIGVFITIIALLICALLILLRRRAENPPDTA